MQKLFRGVARWLAILGGIVLLLLIVLTCLSVLGRLANGIGHSAFVEQNVSWAAGFLTTLGPINGDFEIVEASVAFSIFAFMPWCIINRGHARVDIMTAALPDVVNSMLGLLWDIVFLIVMSVISWRLFIGMSDKKRYMETTFLLEFPVWWGFAVSAVASVFAALAVAYMIYTRLKEFKPKGAGSAMSHRRSANQ